MKKYKVQKIIVCEVSVWGYVEADNMHSAMIKAAEIGTGQVLDFDHEIITDIKTTNVEIDEVNNG
jgi:hypothetical protein